MALSIVGVEKDNSGLYAGKLVQEDEVKHGGVPWTILRSTQFQALRGSWGNGSLE